MSTQTAEKTDDMEGLPPHEVHYRKGTQLLFQSLDAMESAKRRTFAGGNDYKAKMGLVKGDPAKQDFRAQTKIPRDALKAFEKCYNTKVLKSNSKGSGENDTRGFYRSVILNPEITKFMKCADWGLVSTADPSRGFVIAIAVTNYFNIYFFVNNLSHAKDHSLIKCDDRLKALFGDVAKQVGVDLNSMKQTTGLQKLLPKFETSVLADDFSEPKLKEHRKKCEPTGEFGKVIYGIKELKDEMKAIEKKILEQSNKSLIECLASRPGQQITEMYKEEVRSGLAQYQAAADKIKALCTANDIPFSKDFPHAIPTALDQ